MSDNAQLTGLCDRFRGIILLLLMLKRQGLTLKLMHCLRSLLSR